ncbi:porin [Burkholderia sp. Bp9140]|uniref:porin n=1 Tax=Burkholderia sp. Bp9140 TaxID=2184572 RepID=UPI000F567BD1|nr:porin [Burkholderia sp. Bp9140]RQR51657.1 porin [Burkholderia sp. Bp9140]
MKKACASAFLTLLASTAAHAQSSVTLYGILDTGLNFTSNANGHRALAMVSGDPAETSFGIKGTEDLGRGLSAIFVLENGTNLNTGALAESGRLFKRQAFVGLASSTMGTVTLGRQYDATIDMWSPFTAAGNTIGDLAAHPFDNDNADYDYRLNNSVKYVSPTIAGFQAEGVFGFSNSPGFANNQAYSVGISYAAGPLSAAVAYLHQSNSNASDTGAIAEGVFSAERQENIAAGVRWMFSGGSNVALAYSHVSVNNPTANAYVGDIGPQYWTSWRFDNFEVNGQYFLDPALSIVGAYTFTRGRLSSTAEASTIIWHQVSMMLNYALSKRTSVYLQGAYMNAHGKTGTGLDSAYIIGSAGTSSTGNQSVFRLGMTHHF